MKTIDPNAIYSTGEARELLKHAASLETLRAEFGLVGLGAGYLGSELLAALRRRCARLRADRRAGRPERVGVSDAENEAGPPGRVGHQDDEEGRLQGGRDTARHRRPAILSVGGNARDLAHQSDRYARLRQADEDAHQDRVRRLARGDRTSR